MRTGTLTLLIALALSLGLAAMPMSQPTAVAQDEMGLLSGKKIYFSTENGEPSRFDRSERGLSRFAGTLTQLGVELSVFEWNLGIPSDADVLVIIGPTASFDPDQVARLWLYLNSGGRVLLASEPFQYRSGVPSGMNSAESEFQDFYELGYTDFGVSVRNEVLLSSDQPALDVEDTATVIVPDAQAQALNLDLSADILAADHPITAELGSVSFNGLRSLEIDINTPTVVLEPIVFAPLTTYGVSTGDMNSFYRAASRDDDDNTFDLELATDESDIARILAATLEIEETDARMVIMGDSDVFLNGGGYASQPYYSANFIDTDTIQFTVNTVSWLAEARTANLSLTEAAATATPTLTPTLTPTEPAG